MSCSMNDHCCQQSGLCPNYKICKPNKSLQQPWKRFTCECKGGYGGDKCDQPIRSCRGYANVLPQKSGKYKLLDSRDSVYEAYCHFDKDGAWSLVQSFSYANGSVASSYPQFRKPLSQDFPVGESNPVWSGYRLSRSRMYSIKKDALLLRFTCDYNMKTLTVENSDYLQMQLGDVGEDILKIHGHSSEILVQRGKIGGKKLNACSLTLDQHYSMTLHVSGHLFTCGITPVSIASHCNTQSYYSLFGNYDVVNACFEKTHRCIASSTSTTQLWFGH